MVVVLYSGATADIGDVIGGVSHAQFTSSTRNAGQRTQFNQSGYFARYIEFVGWTGQKFPKTKWKYFLRSLYENTRHN
jgi:hypothetical protein